MATRYAVSLATSIAEAVPSCSTYAAAIADAIDAGRAAAVRASNADDTDSYADSDPDALDTE